MSQLTLLRQGSKLADASHQLQVLRVGDNHKPFEKSLAECNIKSLKATGIEVLQMNVGKLCNQTCQHCHVDAGPDRRELMSRETMAACLDVLRRNEISVVDITGGAPEMNPHFRWFVSEARRLQKHVIDRCNLTILLARGFEDLPEFLAEHHVEIVASLPCYLEENTDAQRGTGVFRKSIEALQALNSLGYGRSDSDLTLTLVYNPVGPALPPNQEQLEAAYRRELMERYGISFNRLFTITNLPISRFLDYLLQTGEYTAYMEKLIDAFNPVAAEGVMCRTMISVDWHGNLHDCDFNQMLDLGVGPGLPCHINDFDNSLLANREIQTGQHCYGCTAGAGSSCQGSIT